MPLELFGILALLGVAAGGIISFAILFADRRKADREERQRGFPVQPARRDEDPSPPR